VPDAKLFPPNLLRIEEMPYYQHIAGAVNHPDFSLSVAFTHPLRLMTICVPPSDDNRHFETPRTRALGGLKKGKRRKPSLPPPFHSLYSR